MTDANTETSTTAEANIAQPKATASELAAREAMQALVNATIAEVQAAQVIDPMQQLIGLNVISARVIALEELLSKHGNGITRDDINYGMAKHFKKLAMTMEANLAQPRIVAANGSILQSKQN